MKIKDIFFIISVFCVTVLPSTTIVLGGLVLISSCTDAPEATQKTYGVKWLNGNNMDEITVWITTKELSLGQYQFDPYTKAKFEVVSIPAGCKVKAIKAGTDKTAVITVDRPTAKGDTITWYDGVYYVPK